MGTADYIAPEQAEDAHNADIRADIYSLGCSLYHLLCGRPMLAGASVTRKLSAHLTGKLPLSELPTTVPAELRAVLAKMVAKDPGRRYQTPGEVAAALVPFFAKATVVADESQSRGRGRRWPILWLPGGAVAVVALLLVGIWLASRERQRPESGIPPIADAQQPEKLPPTYTSSIGMEFVLVPRGKSWLGGGAGQPGNQEVEIKADFYLGKYEVTQEEWGKVMEAMLSHFSRAGPGKDTVKDIPDADLKRFPVENVTWDDAQLFLGHLNKRDKREGWVYRLPKELEWEYACRGGPMSDKLDSAFDFYFEKPLGQLQPDQANFEHGKGLKRTCKVGSYQPNKLGLYDMHGNVWEWCEDLFDPKDPKAASHRVIRGGGWDYDSRDCRAAHRLAHAPSHPYFNIGLRLARVPVGKESK
jgi:formylglycine-generating enzyme required for sulfatase activity